MSQNRSSALFFQEWTVQKAGLTPNLNEDAFLIRNAEPEGDFSRLLIAISDGATEAVYSRLWARKLVEAAESDWPLLADDELGDRLKQVCKEFSPFEPGKEVPWFVRNKYMDQGSQATLLVATVADSKDADSFDIRAVSVGDCCLFVFKASGEVLSFPVQHSDEFGVNPVLLGNRLTRPLKYDHWQGHIEPGDLLLIGTDALSKWALQCLERRHSGLLFDALLELLTPDITNSNQMVEESFGVDLPLDTAVAKTPENRSDELKGAEKSSARRGLLRRLLSWGSTESHDTTELSDKQQVTLEVKANQPNEESKHNAPQNAQSLTEEGITELPSKFERFIERYRAPASALHMRNDDSTLVVCVPVHNPSADREQEALQVIISLKFAVAERLQTSQQVAEISSD
jgi:hypothetical protein